MTLGDIIKQYRLDNGLSMDSFSEKSGITKGYISMLEKNKHPKTGNAINPSLEVIKKVSETINIDLDTLLKTLDSDTKIEISSLLEDEEKEYKKVYKVPVYGEIAGGVPLAEIIDIIDYEEVDEHTWNRGELFALRVKGQSMEPRICNGDVVILRKQNTFNDGDICAVRVDDEGATLKKVSSDNTGLYLIPTNESYPTRFFSKKELNEVNIEVLGKVIELRGKF